MASPHLSSCIAASINISPSEKYVGKRHILKRHNASNASAPRHCACSLPLCATSAAHHTTTHAALAARASFLKTRDGADGDESTLKSEEGEGNERRSGAPLKERLSSLREILAKIAHEAAKMKSVEDMARNDNIRQCKATWFGIK